MGATGALEEVPAVIPAGSEEVGLRVNELWVVMVLLWLMVVVVLWAIGYGAEDDQSAHPLELVLLEDVVVITAGMELVVV